MIWLLAGYMWLFVHRPWEVWPALGPLHLERVCMIVTILYWALAVRKTWFNNRLHIAFLLFAGAITTSAALSQYNCFQSNFVDGWYKTAVLYILLVSTVRDERDLNRLVIAFVVVMGLYMAHSLREFLCGRYIYRMGIRRMVGIDRTYNDPNTFGATVLYSLPMVYPLWFECRKRWHRWALAGYLALAVTCILLTGSRAAFVGLCFLGVLTAGLLKQRTRLVLLLVIAAPLIWTSLRPDLQNRFLTLIDPSYGPKNAQGSAEGRSQGWRDGVRLWRENPVLGIGPAAFRRGSSIGIQSHHLYGQVLGELGTVGAVAFALVVVGFIANAFECRRHCRLEPQLRGAFPTRVISAVTVTVALLLVLGFGGHNLYRYTWLWFGAFQAIALHCLRRQEVEAAEPGVAVELGGLHPASS